MILEVLKVVGLVALSAVAVRSVLVYWRVRKVAKALEEQCRPRQVEESRLRALQREYETLQRAYAAMRKEHAHALQRVSRYELGIGTVDDGPYEADSSAQSLDALESKLRRVQDALKNMVKAKAACTCDTVWYVDNRKATGTKMINREIKLRLRCFDNACKAAFSLVEWNNVNRLKERLREAFREINRSGEPLRVALQEPYLRLRIEELELRFEIHDLKDAIKEQEREERRIAREAEREEKRLKEAAEKATLAREFHEELLARELARLQSLGGDDFSSMQAQIDAHREELARLRETESRALSMAQQTRAGYVYVISNVVSFGEGICKIGMTRRVDPHDRVKELGDASVPELFDIHAFIYSEDAPSLEKFLHSRFSRERVNLVNSRKEFFFVSPDQVLRELEDYPEEFSIHLPSGDGRVDLVATTRDAVG